MIRGPVRKLSWAAAWHVLGCALGLILVVGPALADDFTAAQRDEIIRIVRDALKTDPSILRDAIDAIRSDQAEQQAAKAREMIAANHDALYDKTDPSAGNSQAAVTMVLFYDTRCPYCRQLEPLLATWSQHDSGIRIIYKDLPILGPASVLGSRALLAAQRQGRYTALRDAIMRSPPDVTESAIRDDAQSLGIDWPRLQRDMGDPAIQQRLDRNIRLAKTLGIEGTPAFVIGDRLVVGTDMSDIQAAMAAARGKRG